MPSEDAIGRTTPETCMGLTSTRVTGISVREKWCVNSVAYSLLEFSKSPLPRILASRKQLEKFFCRSPPLRWDRRLSLKEYVRRRINWVPGQHLKEGSD
ncbi:hypothetical protein RUM43_006375 [Polyplax serrata]|uniref:Uncharacterized protein n=1 Tax=Polyplax serrata TaxID=468196 RepID=A0AAN8PBC0_POLSC